MNFPLTCYNGLRGLWERILQSRRDRELIDAERIDEFRGHASVARPEGDVLWIVGASVGECLSALPLVEALVRAMPDLNIVITSRTSTAAAQLEGRLPPGVVHQFTPLDHPDWVRRFTDHWRPVMVCWIEAEFWPNLVFEADRRGIPRILLNARLSEKSFRRWTWLPNTIRRMVGGFELIRTVDQQRYGYFRVLGGQDVAVAPSLKCAAVELNDDAELSQRCQKILAGKEYWLAASVHGAEVTAVLAAHRTIKVHHPETICILVPRYPNEATMMAAAAVEAGQTALIDSETDLEDIAGGHVWIVDRLGVLGVFYRLADSAFIGGSLTPVGGHNMHEAILLECLPIVGPALENFQDQKRTYSDGNTVVSDPGGLAAAGGAVRGGPARCRRRAREGRGRVLEERQHAENLLAEVVTRVRKARCPD